MNPHPFIEWYLKMKRERGTYIIRTLFDTPINLRSGDALKLTQTEDGRVVEAKVLREDGSLEDVGIKPE